VAASVMGGGLRIGPVASSLVRAFPEPVAAPEWGQKRASVVGSRGRASAAGVDTALVPFIRNRECAVKGRN
jgi:hypothetical protein